MDLLIVGTDGKPERPRWTVILDDYSRAVCGHMVFACPTLDVIGFDRYDRSVPMITEMTAAVALFHSLADHSRLSILRRLSTGEARVRDLTDELGLAQSTVSEHVGCLRECGLVIARSEGRQNFYSVSTPEVIDVLEAAERLLAATGYKIDLCKTYGRDAR